jgi:2-C-methyl-D-erythritol 4-phosphate cytidylyltransferase
MQEYIIIVAGGSGSRMQSDLPKQFLPLHDKVILLHTIDRFLSYNPDIRIIICCPKDFLNYTKELLSKHQYPNTIEVVEGGATRFHSVKNGLNVIENMSSLVGVHDAARPLVSKETIARCYRTALEKGNAIPVIGLNESLRKVEGERNEAQDRSAFRIVQTPQCFTTALLKEAFLQEYSPLFTDDASVLEKAGYTIHLTEGNTENIKITVPADLLLAEVLLKNKE